MKPARLYPKPWKFQVAENGWAFAFTGEKTMSIEDAAELVDRLNWAISQLQAKRAVTA